MEEQQSWSCICVYKYVRVIRLRERVAMVCEERAQQGEREQETGGATSGDVNDERAMSCCDLCGQRCRSSASNGARVAARRVSRVCRVSS